MDRKLVDTLKQLSDWIAPALVESIGLIEQIKVGLDSVHCIVDRDQHFSDMEALLPDLHSQAVAIFRAMMEIRNGVAVLTGAGDTHREDLAFEVRASPEELAAFNRVMSRVMPGHYGISAVMNVSVDSASGALGGWWRDGR